MLCRSQRKNENRWWNTTRKRESERENRIHISVTSIMCHYFHFPFFSHSIFKCLIFLYFCHRVVYLFKRVNRSSNCGATVSMWNWKRARTIKCIVVLLCVVYFESLKIGRLFLALIFCCSYSVRTFFSLHFRSMPIFPTVFVPFGIVFILQGKNIHNTNINRNNIQSLTLFLILLLSLSPLSLFVKEKIWKTHHSFSPQIPFLKMHKAIIAFFLLTIHSIYP